MKQILRDAKYSLQNDSTISREAIIKNIIDPFWKLWSKFDYITKTTPD
ncbi:hypothetical protein IJM86_08700 [bacterium]|nr:hypothetical protein [bacterium]